MRTLLHSTAFGEVASALQPKLLMTLSVDSSTDNSDRYKRWSSAVTALARGMWTGMSAPEQLKMIRRQDKKLRVKHGPWKQDAGRVLLAAAKTGKLNVYVVPDDELKSRRRGVLPHATIMSVPPAIIKQLITVRGTLPDHAYRPSLKATDGDKKLLCALETGFLVINETEFEEWYRRERAKGKWPSQRHQGTPVRGRGRPTKQTGRLRDAIIALVRDGGWTAKAGFNEVRRLLITKGHDDVPNSATLRALVDQICLDTGAKEFRRDKRCRRKKTGTSPS